MGHFLCRGQKERSDSLWTLHCYNDFISVLEQEREKERPRLGVTGKADKYVQQVNRRKNANDPNFHERSRGAALTLTR